VLLTALRNLKLIYGVAPNCWFDFYPLPHRVTLRIVLPIISLMTYRPGPVGNSLLVPKNLATSHHAEEVFNPTPMN
jgi:hypothetical protein